MPAQKRSASDMENDDDDSPSPVQQQQQQQEQNDSEGSPPSSVDKDKDEFILVKLSEIRKEVQCPICLGIIRKTRTVMECLHRFCRECIDKSMRLGNNECPACRTHCASRRSLRDDPKYDALIAALYPDIDKYEEEELAFHEEEKNRNKQIQASIAQTFQRQSEALGRRRATAKATAAALARKSGSYRSSSYLRGRGRQCRDTGGGSDDDDDDVNGNEGGKDSSSADEPSPDVRPRRNRRWGPHRFSSASNADGVHDDNDEAEVSRESTGASPGRAGNPEVLVWGRGGTRSHTRYGSLSGSNGKNSRNSRVAKLVDYLRNLEENDNELDVHITLLPIDEESVPSLERPHLCCRPSLSIRHLCQFISLQIPVQAEELEILLKVPKSSSGSTVNASTSGNDLVRDSNSEPSEEMKEMQILGDEETLRGLHASSSGNLVFIYRSKPPS
ncbi:putative E3 ubiquitin-protein ligase RING1a isoform X1 [Aristolochia californica]|uniref:putative E3 ubiquitin-protein ligase RING1a isoform X1 n=2 Tax=Aristolochia californica TaxID=171875 RepID=UPI0035DC6230